MEAVQTTVDDYLESYYPIYTGEWSNSIRVWETPKQDFSEDGWFSTLFNDWFSMAKNRWFSLSIKYIQYIYIYISIKYDIDIGDFPYVYEWFWMAKFCVLVDAAVPPRWAPVGLGGPRWAPDYLFQAITGILQCELTQVSERWFIKLQ